MSLSKEEKLAAAESLFQAEWQLSPVDALTVTYESISTAEAYEIQLININQRKEKGQIVVGKKIGLTSKAMQQALGVPEPDYGHLMNTMILDEEEPILVKGLIQPKVEAEIAFILDKDLKGPGITIADVYRASAGVMPAFEIIDSRIKDWKIKLPDTIADNASSAAIILGTGLTPLKKLDLRHLGMVLEKNGRVIDTAAGAAVLGHPAVAVAWLANKLSQFGITLEAGEIILSGALVKAYEMKPGEIYTAGFAGMGRVKAVFQ